MSETIVSTTTTHDDSEGHVTIDDVTYYLATNTGDAMRAMARAGLTEAVVRRGEPDDEVETSTKLFLRAFLASESGSRLRDATLDEARESAFSEEGFVTTFSWRCYPSTASDADDRFERAGSGNFFATEQEAIAAAIALDRTSPVEGGEWCVDGYEHRRVYVTF